MEKLSLITVYLLTKCNCQQWKIIFYIMEETTKYILPFIYFNHFIFIDSE